MKKILIVLMSLLISSAAFADTLTVVKGNSSSTYCKTYTNMKMAHVVLTTGLKDDEYLITEYGLYYKVDGKTYLTTMYELELD